MSSSKALQEEKEFKRGGAWGKLKTILAVLGPGFITGSSDDDPSGIGTYAQTGAQFGYLQLWMALFTTPLMIVVQEMCARIALQTGGGLAEAIRKHYPKPVLYLCVALLFIANTINIGADLGAMAASGQLLLGLPFMFWLIGIALVSLALEILLDYKQYARVLRLLTLPLFAYVFVPFVSSTNWGQALRSTFLPTIQWGRDYLLNLVAVAGTTISPYLFFWQAAEEVEEEITEGKATGKQRRGVSRIELKWMRTDVAMGMLFSNITMWFIIATTSATLFQHGVKNIQSALQAAESLRPIAGDLAYLLFAVGIIGTGLLAVPILAGSTAYAVAETFKLREGLYLKLRQAQGFYGVIAFSTLLGFAMNLIGINPIQALYYTAVLNGIVAPPLLVMILLIGNNRQIMHGQVNGRVSNVLGWLTTIGMSVAALVLLLNLGAGQ